MVANRALYREKFARFTDILRDTWPMTAPAASFYLWPKTPVSDEDFARGLFEQQNVTVLPGSFLSRTANGINPGQNRVRMALVAPLDECIDAANRIKVFCNTL